MLPGHPSGHRKIGYLFRGVRPHLQAMWQSGRGDLIQQIGDHLHIGVQGGDADSVESWKRYAGYDGEGSWLGSRPTIGNTRDKVPHTFKHCRGRNFGVNGH